MKNLTKKVVSLAVISSAVFYSLAPKTMAQNLLSESNNQTSTPQLLAQSQRNSFISVGGHDIGGDFRIMTENSGKRYLVLNPSFYTESGPSLQVLLHRQNNPVNYNSDNYIKLGNLEHYQGFQRYEIPQGVSLSEFRTVVIWCQPYNVTFGYARL